MAAKHAFAPTGSLASVLESAARRRAPAALVVTLASILVAACSSGSSDDDTQPPPDPPVEPTGYRIGGTVSGLKSDSVRVLLLSHQPQEIDVGNGPFVFPEPVPDGLEFAVAAVDPLDPAQRCDVVQSTIEIESADVTDIVITCLDAYTVGGTVTGLEQPGLKLGLTIQDAISTSTPVESDGPFSFAVPVLPGETYEAYIDTRNMDESFTQKCVVTNGSGTAGNSNITDVDVTCGDATVSFTVSGLAGEGLVVELRRESEINGNVEMLSVERIDVAADGVYTFKTVLANGEPYEVGIQQQPSNPEQDCSVENASGTIEGDVTDVLVLCPRPYRYYRFDDAYTKWHAVPSHVVDPADPDPPATPLEDGEQLAGVLLDDYFFGSGQSVPLGLVSGLESQDLFRTYLDARAPNGLGDAIGVVYSNATGKTYWLAVESPRGVPLLSHHVDPTGSVFLASHYTTLETWWRFRKIDQATFRLEVTRAELLGFDNRDHWFKYDSGEAPAGSLTAAVDLRIRAFKAGPGDALEDSGGDLPDAETFFDVHGRMELVGLGEPKEGCTGKCDGPWPVKWTLEPEVRADALESLWSTDDDGNVLTSDFTLETSPYVVGEDQVARAWLEEPIAVEIDLSGVPVGEEIFVLSEAWVRGHNTFSPEGGSAAYLRDPASLEPADGSDGAGGAVTVETSGLLMLDFAPTPGELDALRGASPALPPPCDASSASSELAFDAASYLQPESPDGRSSIRITRSGSTEGTVAARVQLTGGSAVAGEDFAPDDLIVVFGPGSSAARTLELPIIGDAQREPDETLTLTLVEPVGCATIGSQGSAEVTIVDDDEFPGVIAFTAADFDVDEGAGLATLTLVRTGGSDGVVEATIESTGGSATAGADYTPLLTTVTFADGDAGPRDVLVTIADDLLAEVDEAVTFALSSANGQIGDPATAVLTIHDDDQNQASTVQFATAALVAVEAQGIATVEVTRQGDVAAAASVRLTTQDGTAVAGDDYGPLDTVVSFAEGEASRAVDLVILADALAEEDETLTLELSEPSGLALGTPATAEVVITENDGTAWGAWQADVEIDAASGAANHAQVAFDGDGNALAIWVQEAAGRTDVWSNYYQAGIGWNTATLVEQNDVDLFAGDPRIGFDQNGNAIAVWTQTDAVTDSPSVWANRFEPALGWGTPERLEADPNEVLGAVALAVHANGDAVAAWAQFDGTYANVFANRYTAGGGWNGPELVDDTDAIVADPTVAVASNGDILVVWEQSPTGVVRDIWARRFTAASGWDAPALVSTTNTGAATDPQVAFDGADNAIVLWLQNPGFDRAVHAARHTAASGWETPVLVGPGPDAEQHRLAVDAAGNAVAVWRRAETVNGQVVLTVFGSRFSPANGWENAVALSSGDAFYPSVGLRPDGHALAVWHELDLSQPFSTAYSVWSNRYTVGEGWRFPEQVGSGGTLIGVGMPTLAIGPSGEAFAIWTRGGEVRVNRFE